MSAWRERVEIAGGRAVHIRIGDFDAAARLVRVHHYTGRPASNVQMAAVWHESGGLFGDYGTPIAALTFSVPPTRWSEDVWELTRLVRVPECNEPLSGLIAAACRAAKFRNAHLLVSFADRTAGHHGGIYQAASWCYAGCRLRSQDGLLIDGKFVPGRTCNSVYGTRSVGRLFALRGIKAEPHYDEGKHLYWRALTREGRRRAERLGLEAQAYPKPTRQPDLLIPETAA